MIRELFMQDLSLWTCLWQSTAFVALGLVGCRLLRRRPSRAYQVLLFAMMAAVVVPFLSAVVKHFDLGAFVATETELPPVFQEMPLATSAPAPDGVMNAAPPESTCAEAAVPTSFSIPWWMVMLYGWMVATLALFGRLVVTFLYGVHLVRHASRDQCEPIQQAADRAGAELGIACGLQVRASGRIRSPIVWCWSRRPILLVPDHCEDPAIDWTGVVAHELAHCRRRDHVTGLAAEVAASLLPWNPLMWVSKRYLVWLGEQACDDWVVAAGAPSEDYAESLLRFRPQRQMAFLPAVVHSKRGLAARVRRILSDACADPHAGPKWALSVTIVALCAGLVVAFAQTRPASAGAEPEQPKPSAKSLHEAAADGDLKQVKQHISKGADVNATVGESARTPLIAAAQGGHAEVVKVLLASGARVDMRDARGLTPLIHAILSHDNKEVVKALVAGGADVNQRSGPRLSSAPALSFAVWRRRLAIMEVLLEAGADVDAKDTMGFTPLHYAAFTFGGHKEQLTLILSKRDYPETVFIVACKGDLEKVRALLADGDVNMKDEFGCTLLHWAALADSPQVADFLLAKGAAVNARGGAFNLTPLLSAHALPVVELLVSKGADIDAIGMDIHTIYNEPGRTKLHLACSLGDKDMAEFLIGKGAAVNVRAARDRTPLMQAAARGHVQVVELLIANGADINARDSKGQTALSLAKEQGRDEIVDILRRHGAQEESRAAREDARPMGDNDSPAAPVEPVPAQSLCEAAKNGDVAAVKRLIAEGTDLNTEDENKNPPLCQAVKSGNLEAVKLLVEAGAAVNAGDWPPLCVAVDEDNVRIAKYLIEKGANIDIPEGWTALQEAPYANSSSLEMIRLLIAKGGDVNAGPYTALHGAVDKNRLDMIELLLEKGADINAIGKRGQTPLCMVAGGRNLDMARLLIAKGADISIPDEGGLTPLHWAAMQAMRGNSDMLDLFLSQGDQASIIHMAAYRGDLDQVKRLIGSGIEVNTKDQGGWTPLHWAGLTDSLELAEFLIAKGADVNANAEHGFTPLRTARSLPLIKLLVSKGADVNCQDTFLGLTKLHNACQSGDIELVRLLINSGADVNAKPASGGMYGRTPLHFAAIYGHRDIANLLISKGADMHAVCPWRNDYRQTALHLAARNGRAEVVEYLLAEGFDVNVQDNKGQTPLDLATQQNHQKVIELLKKHGAGDDSNAASQGSKPITLHEAVTDGDIAQVGKLIAQGANVNARDNREDTPLLQAIKMQRLSFVEPLIAAGANVNAADRQGKTPLYLAKEKGYTELVQILTQAAEEQRKARALSPSEVSIHKAARAGNLEQLQTFLRQGVDVDVKDENGRTPLHCASIEGRLELVRFLIRRGADVNAKEDEGDYPQYMTPLHRAALRGHRDIAEILIANGADVNAQSRRGGTPLHLAALQGHKEVVQLLLASGADVNAKDKEGQTPMDAAKVMSRLPGHEAVQAEIMQILTKATEEQTPAERKPSTDASPSVPDEPVPAKSLREAAGDGDVERVKQLIADGANVNETEAVGLGQQGLGQQVEVTPLISAASGGHTRVVKVLLDNGAKVDATCSVGYTALYYALWSVGTDDIEQTIKILIANGADVNRRPPQQDGCSPLIHAIWMCPGHEGIVRDLLDAGADIDTKDNNGFAPLYWAAFDSSKDILNLILSRGNYVDTIHLAACRGDLSRVKELLAQGIDVNTRDEFGCVPLHWAVLPESPGVAEFLMSKGADVNAKDARTFTPLMAARGLPVIELLVSKGADIQAQESLQRMTKLHMACREADKDVLQFLIGRGAEVDRKNGGGQTPLWLAASYGQKEIAEFLINQGADVDATDSRRKATPLLVAVRSGHEEVVELLIANGADVNHKDTIGRRALSMAKNHGHTEIVELLQKHGAKE